MNEDEVTRLVSVLFTIRTTLDPQQVADNISERMVAWHNAIDREFAASDPKPGETFAVVGVGYEAFDVKCYRHRRASDFIDADERINQALERFAYELEDDPYEGETSLRYEERKMP